LSDGWFTETLHDGYGQSFEILETLAQEKTAFQDLSIFQTRALGRVLVLDGTVQTTEADEFYYHEMIAHLPLFAQEQARRVLIIGGGDGGTLREVLKHSGVEQATLVEIDERVVELSRRFLPNLSRGAFDDPRGRLIIGDGTKFVERASETFDVIIVDSKPAFHSFSAMNTATPTAYCRTCSGTVPLPLSRFPPIAAGIWHWRWGATIRRTSSATRKR
jgi:spermidine synthase